MKLSKDEARILATVLADAKYTLLNQASISLETRTQAFQNLAILEDKLNNAGNDLRRKGRKSHDSFTDMIKRFANKTYGGNK